MVNPNIDINNINGMLLYYKNTDNRTFTYSILKNTANNEFIIDNYLSTSTLFISSPDIDRYKKLTNSESTICIIRDNESLLNMGDKNYFSEFSDRLKYVLNKNGIVYTDISSCDFYDECSNLGTEGTCIPQERQLGPNYGYCIPPSGKRCPKDESFEVATPHAMANFVQKGGNNALYDFRDNFLLTSEKGVRYTTLYYYIGNTIDYSFYLSNSQAIIDLFIDVILPIINRLKNDHDEIAINQSDANSLISILNEISNYYEDQPEVLLILTEIQQDILMNVNRMESEVVNSFVN